eukprot:TRINITY_DN15792_c0_g2_i1.p2 TRINITY_DN15792_c0_g2~~TRINITY_DN15792_c0_g2_i1.p2  ORF type:complete len:509 (+),score=98.77 TRINITY_DN15792_c0_g2_i1:29-1555(+)
MLRRPPRSTHCISSAASDVYKRQGINAEYMGGSLDGIGTAASLDTPAAVVFCPRDGALYVAESAKHRVRRVERSGIVTTVAGTGVAGATDGAGNLALFNEPSGITTDGTSLFVTERLGHRVRKIAYTGTNPRLSSAYTVSTVCGNGTAGAVDGSRTAVRLNQPLGICRGSDGAFYVAESNGRRVRRVDPSGATVTIAGKGTAGSADGDGDDATFGNLVGITSLRDATGGVCLVVADRTNHTLRQIRLKQGASPTAADSWVVQTLAGLAGSSGSSDGSGLVARLNSPRSLATDANGNVLVADGGNHRIRRLHASSGYFPVGVLTGSTEAEPVRLANADGLSPWAGGNPRPFLNCPDLAGGATSDPVTWSFAVPEGVPAFEFTVTLEASTDPYAPVTAVDGDASGGLGSGQVLVRTLAGSANANGFVDGIGTNARFRCLIGLDLDADGNLFVVDGETNSIRRVEPSGLVSTVAGVRGLGSGHVNGAGNIATFMYPTDVAVVPAGTPCTLR